MIVVIYTKDSKKERRLDLKQTRGKETKLSHGSMTNITINSNENRPKKTALIKKLTAVLERSG
jgi:hypothetical protein